MSLSPIRREDPQRDVLDVDIDLAEHLDELVLDESDDDDEPVLRWRDVCLADPLIVGPASQVYERGETPGPL